MSGSGAPILNRIVTFMEVNFSQNWEFFGLPDYDGFVNWRLIETEGEQVGSISITRSDGKVLSFFVTSTLFVFQTRENVIRWPSSGADFPGSDGPFQ